MENIKDAIEYYLNSETDHAVLITGEWGTGKTYYLKNTLFNLIRNLNSFKDESKKYKPIIISLFGLNSIEEIQTNILLELHPILKNKFLNIGSKLLKVFSKGALNLGDLGEVYYATEDSKTKSSEFINLNEVVLCFDDLERIGKNISYGEIIGYINSLVDENNVKVIIIANEDKIEPSEYSNIKEKVIGVTIEFRPELKTLCIEIIEARYASYSIYKKYLISNIDLISNLFEINATNLRIFKFALDKYKNIFSTIEKIITKESTIHKYKDEILLNSLIFTIATTIEFRKGNISFKNRVGIDFNQGIELFEIEIWSNDKFEHNETREISFREKFIKSFYNNQKYFYFETIFNFIIGGFNINEEDFFTELHDIYKINTKSNNAEYEVIRILGDNNEIFSLSDKKYVKFTKDMLIFLDKGAYDLDYAISIFLFVIRFNNPLNIDPSRLEKRIILSMKKRIRISKYDPALDIKVNISSDSLYYKNLNNIRESIRVVVLL